MHHFFISDTIAISFDQEDSVSTCQKQQSDQLPATGNSRTINQDHQEKALSIENGSI